MTEVTGTNDELWRTVLGNVAQQQKIQGSASVAIRFSSWSVDGRC